MNKPFDGKKLLILGATAGEVSLVKRAQELGAYVIAADYHTDYSLSPAKAVADEAWDISWSDIDGLERLAREAGVNGVAAGYSEFRVENQIKLCQRLGLPCYATMEQLEITRDKQKFKDTCRRCGVPVVKEYPCPADVDQFPVIVKPVDRAGSIGVGIASNPEELARAYAYAMEKSVSKHVIIEKFIHDGVKVDVYYGVEDGEIYLLSSCDTVNAADNGFERVVQSSWLYPERHLDAITEKVDRQLREMIRFMGIRYGCIFFSGFIDENREFVFFECGFRLEGGHQYEFVSRSVGVNFMDIFLFHALTGSTRTMPRNPAPDDALKCVTINLYAKAGVISSIAGMDSIREMDRCTLALLHAKPGTHCTDDQAILTKIGMFSFAHRDPALLRQDVEMAYALFQTLDQDGNDMIYDRIDTALIEHWWEPNPRRPL